MKKLIMLGLAVLGLMTSCSNDELIKINQGNGSDIIGFTTHVDKATRVTDDEDLSNITLSDFSVYGITCEPNEDGSWDSNSEQLIFNYETVSKIGDEAANVSQWEYDHTQYWIKGNAYKFYAFAPNFKDADWTIGKTKDGNTQAIVDIIYPINGVENNAEDDIIYAYQSVNESTGNDGAVSLNFKHLLSRVKFQFYNSFKASNVKLEITDVTITDTYGEACINLKDNGEVTEWYDFYVVNLIGDTYDKIYFPFTDSDTYATQSNKVETEHKYMFPDPTEGGKAYTVTFKVILHGATSGGMDLDEGEVVYPIISKKVTLPLVEMKQGFSYIYRAYLDEANVADPDDPNFPEGLNPIQFTVEEVKKWDDATDDDTYQFIPIGNIRHDEADKVKKYDYAMSDGSFVHLDDGDELTEEQKDACVGIVYWTKAETEGNATLETDKVLMRDYPDCTHGLIVSLKDLTYDGSTTMTWQGEYDNYHSDDYDEEDIEDICVVFQSEGTYSEYPYVLIGTHLDADYNSPEVNIQRIYGYNNTAVLSAYNLTAEYVMKPVKALTEANLANIRGCSTWFIPSFKELSLIEGDSENARYADFGGKNWEIINEKLSALGEDGVKYNSLVKGHHYYSSSEGSAGDYWGWEIWNGCGEFELDKAENLFYARPVCAF